MMTLLLVSTLFAQTDVPDLTNYDFLTINRPFESLSEFNDNAFLHEEKLAAAEKESEQFEKRRVSMLVEVSSVSKTGITASYFPEVETNRHLPNIWLVSSAKLGEQSTPSPSDDSFIGMCHGKTLGSLMIGELLPLEVAKTLRRGDRLEVVGHIVYIKAAKVRRYPGNHTAEVVIKVREIEPVEKFQLPGEEEGVKDE